MNKTCPIAVYQMGKVGSETILHSLKSLNLVNPIYHVHVLSAQNLERSTKNLICKNLPLTLQLKHGQTLRAYIDSHDKPELKIITAVREPVAQLISAIFQNIEIHFPHFIDADGSWKEEEISQHLYNRLLKFNLKAPNQNCNWFDSEFKVALDINIYKYDFDRTIGYRIVTDKNTDVLVLKLEKSENWGEALAKFFERSSPLEIVKMNLSENKKYRETYKQVISKLKLPIAVLKKIYSSQYCQHFYTQEEIEKFIDLWSA